MDDDEKFPSAEKEIVDETESIPSKEEASHSYEVGYGKPPKNTRFKKGFSGNPNGRPKELLDFDEEFLRECRSPITIHENGRPRRIPKHKAVIKQMVNSAMKGSNSGLRMYREAYRQAFEKIAHLKAQEAADLESLNRPDELTIEELEWLILGGDPKELLRRRAVERQRKKGKEN
jgi:hypothetical protein